MKSSDYLATLEGAPVGAESAGIGDLKKSGLLNALSQCLTAADAARVLAQHIGDADVTAAVQERLGKVRG